ncbi:NADP-dependent oxidoreductase [uncultured Sphaerotilus sp.]|uniref:NADP-dependent oxidoreductase n=1 Tax=uncultured Sphaerotilus sp. TaxID=474984 RepID=UPI0030CA4D76
MQTLLNRQVLLKARPSGIPQAEHFEIVETPVPAPNEGQIVVRNQYLAVEPAMRGWVSNVGNYAEPVPLGGVMRAFTVGRVVASRSPGCAVGDVVTGMFGWQDHAVVDGSMVQRRITDLELPISTALGVLGLNGLTAYFALLDLGQPKAGETVVVSTAAGAVGSCVGQIAKLKGCRTVGIAGGAQKTALCLSEFGYDHAIDYRADQLEERLAEACPNGIDVYFDNTAGAISDAVLKHLAVGARVIICGTASIASWNPPPLGPRVERHLLVKRARMQGFLIFDFADRYPEGLRALTDWVKAGQIHYREDILDGIEHAPDAIAGLYRGENLGKRLIRIAAD